MSKEEEIEKLKERVQELEKENNRLKKIEKDYEETKKQFEELKAKHAATVFNLQKALKIKVDKTTKRKPLGAPKGHKGYARHVPERVDYVKTLIPERCPDCNTKLGETQEIRSRHVTDIKLTVII